MLEEGEVDYTSFFRSLSSAARGTTDTVRAYFVDPGAFEAWAERWRALAPDAEAMDRTNPVYIPRNHLVEEALAAATDGDMGPVNRLVEVLADPYTVRPGLDRYAAPAPDDFGSYRTFCGT
jgi:uncharacterized protein YdiU (UPF0061 family)